MHLNSRHCNTLALVACAGLAGVSSAHAQAFVDQPYTIQGSYTSQNDTTPGGLGNYDTAYDDFSLGAGGEVGKVSWVGEFINSNPAPISGFTVNFYADDSGTPGKPGALLKSQPVNGDAHETPLGLDKFGNSMFTYFVDMPVAFVADPGATYWLSIVPDLPMDINFNPQWGWVIGSGGNGAGYQAFSNAGGSGSFPIGDDLAFTLSPSRPRSPVVSRFW